MARHWSYREQETSLTVDHGGYAVFQHRFIAGCGDAQGGPPYLHALHERTFYDRDMPTLHPCSWCNDILQSAVPDGHREPQRRSRSCDCVEEWAGSWLPRARSSSNGDAKHVACGAAEALSRTRYQDFHVSHRRACHIFDLYWDVARNISLFRNGLPGLHGSQSTRHARWNPEGRHGKQERAGSCGQGERPSGITAGESQGDARNCQDTAYASPCGGGEYSDGTVSCRLHEKWQRC